MTEHWASYFCYVNGKLASIYLDLHLRSTSPDTARSWLLWVWLYFRQPRPDGLSSQEEFPKLCAIEDRLNAVMKEKCRAFLAGRITTEGRREFYYYGSGTDAFEGAVSEALATFPEYDSDKGIQHDPQWGQYLNVLYPSDDDLQKILNREVLDVMAKEGDRPEVPREVLHWSYFPSMQERENFENAICAKGYRVDSESHSDRENPFGVCFAKVQDLAGPSIDESVLEISKITEQFQGEYDGWEAQVIVDERKEQPSSKPN